MTASTITELPLNELVERYNTTFTQVKSLAETARAKNRNLTDDELSVIAKAHDELPELKAEIDNRRTTEAKANAFIDGFGLVTDTPVSQAKARSLGEHFVKAIGQQVRERKGSSGWTLAAPEYKALNPMAKAATDVHVTGTPTLDKPLVVEQDGGLVINRPDRVYLSDILPSGTISGTELVYHQEKLTEGGFKAVGENQRKPQLHFPYEEVREGLTKVAGYIKISTEMLEDADYLVSDINARLLFELNRFIEAQVLHGTGTTQELKGLFNREGVQKVQGENLLRAIRSAMTKITVATGMPADFVAIHPEDYEAIQMTADANGWYFAGGPFTGAYGNGPVLIDPPIWGRRVVQSEQITAGQVLVGASRGAMLLRKGGVKVAAASQNEDDFINNRITVLAEQRLGLAVTRPAAFAVASVTPSMP